MGQLTHRQALVLALFNYGLARDEQEVACQLRIDVAEAARLCSSLVEQGFLQRGTSGGELAA